MKLPKIAACVGILAIPFVALATDAKDHQELRDRLTEWEALVMAGPGLSPEDYAHLVLKEYTYVEPDTDVHRERDVNPTSAAVRLRRDAVKQDSEPLIQIVGDTAIVTGTYLLVDREFEQNDQGPRSRYVAQGRYTTTWVRAGESWKLLAEHRSLNDMQTWAVKFGNDSDEKVTATHSEKDEPVPTPISEALAEKVHRGFLPNQFTRLFSAYEPTSLGFTWDDGDQPFMDFTFSPMVALFPKNAADYPPRERVQTGQKFLEGRQNWSGPNFYFAATLRAGQYLKTRPSSPVVGKRFNPLVAMRFWGEDKNGRRESLHNFFEVVYAHESNGQFISTRTRFDEQLQVYLNQAGDNTPINDPDISSTGSYAAARDNISRGWDYVGLQFSRDWDAKSPFYRNGKGAAEATYGFAFKYNHYLDGGIFQGGKEEYGSYSVASGAGPLEIDPEGKPRGATDGLSFKFSLELAPRDESKKKGWHSFLIIPERRYAITWTTGSHRPFVFNTFKFEATGKFFGTLPVSAWYRHGYNSDLIDYYRKDTSFGLSLNYSDF